MRNLLMAITTLFFVAIFLPVTAQTDNTTDEGVEINGLIWATRNVNAPKTFTEKPEDAGMFYQWNRAIGWSSTDPMVNHLGSTTWNDSEPRWNETWEASNNVCPTGWRVPDLYADFSTLNGVNSYVGELNGVFGKFYDGSDGKTLFFPAAGCRLSFPNNGNIFWAGMEGHFWSNTPLPYTDPQMASNMAMEWFFKNNGSGYLGNRPLKHAYSVRCVKDKEINNSVNEISAEKEKTIIGYCNIMGQRLPKEPKSGFYIILYNDGTAKKVIVNY